MSNYKRYYKMFYCFCLLLVSLVPNVVHAGSTTIKSTASFTVVEGKPTKPIDTSKNEGQSSSNKDTTVGLEESGHTKKSSTSKKANKESAKWLPQLGETRHSIAILLFILVIIAILLQRFQRYVNKKQYIKEKKL